MFHLHDESSINQLVHRISSKLHVEFATTFLKAHYICFEGVSCFHLIDLIDIKYKC